MSPGVTVTPVADDQWGIVAWLWEGFRHDLAPVARGVPYADGPTYLPTTGSAPAED